jgi:hypothetical protein
MENTGQNLYWVGIYTKSTSVPAGWEVLVREERSTQAATSSARAQVLGVASDELFRASVGRARRRGLMLFDQTEGI